MKLGANHYIATANGDAAEQLKVLGGAKVMLVTADKPELIKPLIGGLALGGEMILAATSMEAIGWSTMDFIGGVASVKGTFTDAGELAATRVGIPIPPAGTAKHRMPRYIPRRFPPNSPIFAKTRDFDSPSQCLCKTSLEDVGEGADTRLFRMFKRT